MVSPGAVSPHPSLVAPLICALKRAQISGVHAMSGNSRQPFHDYSIADCCSGKFALSNLVSYLPDESHVSTDDSSQSSSETLCAIISTVIDLVTDSIRTTKYAVARMIHHS